MLLDILCSDVGKFCLTVVLRDLFTNNKKFRSTNGSYSTCVLFILYTYLKLTFLQ